MKTAAAPVWGSDGEWSKNNHVNTDYYSKPSARTQESRAKYARLIAEDEFKQARAFHLPQYDTFVDRRPEHVDQLVRRRRQGWRT